GCPGCPMGENWRASGSAQRSDGLSPCRTAIHAAQLSRSKLVSAARHSLPLEGKVAAQPTGGVISTPATFVVSSVDRAWAAAASVPDPEIPCVTVADLGILRSVEIDDHGVVVARVTPTYSGCPAVLAIELAVEAALLDAGFAARIERVIAPA